MLVEAATLAPAFDLRFAEAAGAGGTEIDCKLEAKLPFI